jgi:hypothetical protein
MIFASVGLIRGQKVDCAVAMLTVVPVNKFMNLLFGCGDAIEPSGRVTRRVLECPEQFF